MAMARTGKWEQLGAALVRCAGPNLEKIRTGLDLGIMAEEAKSGLTKPAAAAKKSPGRKKQSATLNQST